MSVDEPRLRALVSLLADSSPRVLQQAKSALLEIGEPAIRWLEAATDAGDPRLRVRARLALQEVRSQVLVRRLLELRSGLDEDWRSLEGACVLLSLTRDPHLDEDSVRAALDAMADDLETRITGLTSPVAIVHTMSRFFAGELGFRGNQRNYYDAENSYLHRVIDRRVGIPITLCAVYLFVGRRLGLPLRGIGMPGHFVLRYGDVEPAVYLDPFHSGRLMTEEDCRRYLEEGQFGYDPGHLRPMSGRAMLARMIGNLQLIYRNKNDVHQLRVLAQLRAALRGSSATPRRSSIAGKDRPPR